LYNIFNISERTNLAVHAMGKLAQADTGTSMPVSELARGLPVSESHLAKVMQTLVKAGLVASSRGAKGGFTLVRDPRKVTLLEVLETMEGRINEDTCLFGQPICREGTCIMSKLVGEVTGLVRSQLSKTSIVDFAFRS